MGVHSKALPASAVSSTVRTFGPLLPDDDVRELLSMAARGIVELALPIRVELYLQSERWPENDFPND